MCFDPLPLLVLRLNPCRAARTVLGTKYLEFASDRFCCCVRDSSLVVCAHRAVVSCRGPTIAELLERRNASGDSGGGDGSFPGLSGSSVTLHLDEDEAVSDLADSDSEVRAYGSSVFVSCCASDALCKPITFVRRYRREGGGKHHRGNRGSGASKEGGHS